MTEKTDFRPPVGSRVEIIAGGEYQGKTGVVVKHLKNPWMDNYVNIKLDKPITRKKKGKKIEINELDAHPIGLAIIEETV